MLLTLSCELLSWLHALVAVNSSSSPFQEKAWISKTNKELFLFPDHHLIHGLVLLSTIDHCLLSLVSI